MSGNFHSKLHSCAGQKFQPSHFQLMASTMVIQHCRHLSTDVTNGSLIYTPGMPCQRDSDCSGRFSSGNQYCDDGLCVDDVRPTTTTTTTHYYYYHYYNYNQTKKH
ncbi:hypothetical protein KIN20_023876 [Parelaphostrongylus tenuis]|uniref:Uncharacterized protein n=1 Tax=Parelaphostrongylus tenuis TaxID=148309 RepID=A0AAD5QT89_PARTN|nr:hypothetical protein KIN20_023876 [Parelaphostrongylus tenuis]